MSHTPLTPVRVLDFYTDSADPSDVYVRTHLFRGFGIVGEASTVRHVRIHSRHPTGSKVKLYTTIHRFWHAERNSLALPVLFAEGTQISTWRDRAPSTTCPIEFRALYKKITKRSAQLRLEDWITDEPIDPFRRPDDPIPPREYLTRAPNHSYITRGGRMGWSTRTRSTPPELRLDQPVYEADDYPDVHPDDWS